jgi:2-amino-4-hydroxy-6-hydroxymethyldihydropteridine diphosphokinase
MSRAWLGLGGNIGDVPKALGKALQSLDAHEGIKVSVVSSLYRTPPWGKEDQPWFVNAGAEVETNLSPEMLLEACQQVERDGLRERKERWGPRTIDVDIIAFDGVEQIEQRLTLPHPHAHERPFVLSPLAEIAPDLPLVGSSISELAKAHADPRLQQVAGGQNWWRD